MQLNDEEEIEIPEEQVDHRQEITRPDALRMILEKNGPYLTQSSVGLHRPHILLNGGGRDLDSQLEEFSPEPGSTPQSIVLRHLLNQGDGLSAQSGTAAASPRFELPEDAEALAMPAQQSLALKDQQGLFPMGEARHQEEKPEAVSAGELGFLHLALEDNELLAEQRVLGNQLRFAEHEVGDSAQNERRTSGLGQTTEGLIQKQKEAEEETGLDVNKQVHSVENSS